MHYNSDMDQNEYVFHASNAAINDITVRETPPLTPNEIHSHIDGHESDREHVSESEADDNEYNECLP